MPTARVWPGTGADRDRPLEAALVVDGPRRERDDRHERGQAQPHPALTPRLLPSEEHEPEDERRVQDERLGPHQRGRREPGAHADDLAPATALHHPVREVERDGHGEHEDGLDHQHAVVDPEVRVERGERGGDEPDAGTRHPAAEQGHRADGQRAEDAHQVALTLRRVDAELVGRGEDEDEAGWVIGTRRDHAVLEERERVEEAATVGHQPGLVVVPVRVAGLRGPPSTGAPATKATRTAKPDQHDGCEGDLVRRPPRASSRDPLTGGP